MLSAVKDVLTKDIKDIAVKDIKNFLEMEIEIEKLKALLATEVKLKEFLLQEINVSDFVPRHNKAESTSDESTETENIASDDVDKQNKAGISNSKIMLPSFDYALIEKLHTDHEELLFIYRELMKNARDRKYPLVAVHLERFTSRITEHYALADKDLYSYLKVYIQLKYPKRVKAFSELSLEMKNISLSIFFSVSQSPHIPLNEMNYEEFMDEFNQLGSLLRTRINREKQVLFKMYKESNEAKEISAVE